METEITEISSRISATYLWDGSWSLLEDFMFMLELLPHTQLFHLTTNVWMFLISHFIEIIYIISTLWIGSSSIWIIIQFAKIILDLSDRILFLIKCKNPTGWSQINFIKNSNSRKCVQSCPDLLLCPSRVKSVMLRRGEIMNVTFLRYI